MRPTGTRRPPRPALADTIAAIEAADGTFDLILFGNESADSGGFQVGVRVARKLGRPIVNGIKASRSATPPSTASARATSGFEVYNLPLPAVLGVKEGLNLPRYPTLPGRLKSKKAEIVVELRRPSPVGSSPSTSTTPPSSSSRPRCSAAATDAAPAIVDLIERLGLL